MTAEIAIMNKSAVALAADSAVTIGSEKSQKIFNTINKLFTLSKHHPVAIMIYGSAEIMEVPWETIIKLYRKQLGRKHLPHLESYAHGFLRFLQTERKLFPAAEQSKYFKGLVSVFYRRINQEIQEQVKARVDSAKAITPAEIRGIVKGQISKHFAELRRKKNLPGFTNAYASRLVKSNAAVLAKLKNEFFQQLPLSSSDRARLTRMAGWLVARNSFWLTGTSGVVVAGFGDADIYPRLKSFTIEGVVANKLRYRVQHEVAIGDKMISSIIPFAQSEVVKSFIDGIDPGIETLVSNFLDQVFAEYPLVLLNHVPCLPTPDKKKLAAKLRKASGAILTGFREELARFRDQTLVNPIVSTVAVLPKDELAAMAETLVSLTSFKRKFSMDAETVGGPIDVAVLSKGDGFIWIKRKHYFRPELNPQFLTNYLEI